VKIWTLVNQAASNDKFYNFAVRKIDGGDESIYKICLSDSAAMI
jgi:hypothetical protein